MKICLDAGHGESTAGKRSFDGTFREYEFNRDVAQRLCSILKRHGLEVFYSCDLSLENDTPLSTRCKNSNNGKADLFVSIHANAYGTTWNDANGWEIYYCEGSTKGQKIAECIHDESVKMLGLKDRGVKAGKFTVLTDTNAPAVLIEHGFYTNKVEVEKLLSDDFREKCAIADAKGILKYLGVRYVDEVVLMPEWFEGIDLGITDGSNPKDFATREQVVTMIVRAMKYGKTE